MKRLLGIFAVCALVLTQLSADSAYEKYVQKWASTAVREMYRSGVPASITLAQGMLESRCGLSSLASEGNNHFGIKCHSDWKGKTMKADDDKKAECFRVYDSADESFRDHSDFLRYRDRYKFLFDYDVTDYKAWAYGLKKAGYATDPAYPTKLIKLIEDYGLDRYDRASSDSADDSSDDSEVSSEQDSGTVVTPSKEKKSDVKAAQKASKAKSKAAARARKKKKSEVKDEIPVSPLQLEEAVTVQASEKFSFSLSRTLMSKNGVTFVYARNGETYESIAKANNLFLKEILKFNDAAPSAALHAGDIVYLQRKKKKTQKGLDKYIVESDGESLRDICQRFAVRMDSVEKMNGFAPGHDLREGDTILLR